MKEKIRYLFILQVQFIVMASIFLLVSSATTKVDTKCDFVRNDYCKQKSTNGYGHFVFYIDDLSDSIMLDIEKKSNNGIDFREYKFERNGITDFLYLDDHSPYLAYKDTLSKNGYVFFSDKVNEFNTGKSISTEYDIKYLSLLKKKYKCGTKSVSQYLILSKNFLFNTTHHSKPKLFIELIIDSNANIIAIKSDYHSKYFYLSTSPRSPRDLR